MPGSSHPFTLHGQILAKTQAFFSIPRSFHLPLLHGHIPLVPAISCFSGKRLPLSHLTSCCPFLHSQRFAVCNNEFALLAFSSPRSPNSENDLFGSLQPNHTFLTSPQRDMFYRLCFSSSSTLGFWSPFSNWGNWTRSRMDCLCALQTLSYSPALEWRCSCDLQPYLLVLWGIMSKVRPALTQRSVKGETVPPRDSGRNN